MEEEIWKNIVGFRGSYQISNYGRVKSISKIKKIPNKYCDYRCKTKEKILKPRMNKENQWTVCLGKNYKFSYYQVARLVAKHFLKKNLDRKDVVMFKDGNHSNCRTDNLYITDRYGLMNTPEVLDKLAKRQYIYYGKKYSFAELVKISKLKRSTLKSRFALKWNIYESVEIPVCLRKGVNI